MHRIDYVRREETGVAAAPSPSVFKKGGSL
jgi:hypothetical protein